MFKKSILSIVFYSGLKIIVGFLLSKLVVYNFGSFGFGIYSQFQGVLIFLMQFLSIGASSGIIKLVSNDFGTKKVKTYDHISELFFLGFLITLVFLFFSFILENQVRNNVLFGILTLGEYYLLIIFILTIHTFSYWNSVRIGFEEGSVINRNGFWVSLLGLILAYFFSANIKIILIATSIYYLSQVIGSFIFDKRFYYLNSKVKFSFKKIKKYTYLLTPFIIMAFFSSIGQPLVNIIIRDNVSKTFGINFLGNWQGIVKISDALSQIFSVLLTCYLLPKISSASNDSQIYKEVIFFIKSLSPFVILILFLIWLFSDCIILLLYNKTFLSTIYLFKFQLIGDFLRFLNYTIVQVVISKGNWKLSLFADMFISSLLLIIYFLFKDILGFYVVVISYFIAHLAYSIFLYFRVLKKLNNHVICS